MDAQRDYICSLNFIGEHCEQDEVSVQFDEKFNNHIYLAFYFERSTFDLFYFKRRFKVVFSKGVIFGVS